MKTGEPVSKRSASIKANTASKLSIRLTIYLSIYLLLSPIPRLDSQPNINTTISSISAAAVGLETYHS